MNIQHAMIVAKSIFPKAHIHTEPCGDEYLVDGYGFILVVLSEKRFGAPMENLCWCVSKVNTPDYIRKAWAPVETLTEKRWVKELKLWIEELKKNGHYEEGIRY